MEQELLKINKLIEKHVKKHGKADEAIFNLGIELGKILVNKNIQAHRLPFFIEQENKNNDYEKRRQRIAAVCKIVHNIIVLAHKEQVNNDGQIYYEAGWRADNKPLSEEVESKYNVAYKRIGQVNVGGDFDITFHLNGKLKEVFQKHKVGIELTTLLSNSCGDEDEYIITEDDAVDSLSSTSIQLYPHYDNMTVEQVDDFATDVEKFSTFFYLRLS